MVYPVYVYGSHVLRYEAKEVAADFPALKELVEDMFETMYASNGVGLAAPQIGKSLRLFVVDITAYADEDPSYVGFRKAFVNPEIYESSDEEISMGEGCLSVPGMNEEVWRPEQIRIRYLDENMQPRDEQFDGYAARVVQHEYDHLEGTLFTDRLSPLRKTLVRGKLSGMGKGKYSASYKTKQVK